MDAHRLSLVEPRINRVRYKTFRAARAVVCAEQKRHAESLELINVKQLIFRSRSDSNCHVELLRKRFFCQPKQRRAPIAASDKQRATVSFQFKRATERPAPTDPIANGERVKRSRHRADLRNAHCQRRRVCDAHWLFVDARQPQHDELSRSRVERRVEHERLDHRRFLNDLDDARHARQFERRGDIELGVRQRHHRDCM